MRCSPMGLSSEEASARPKAQITPCGLTESATLKPRPTRLGGAPAEGCLPGKETLARSPHPHDGGDESGVQDMVDLRSTTQRSGQRTLEVAQIGLHRAHPAVELALGTEVREVGAQMCLSKAPEISLASEAGPLGEDGQGDYLGIGEQGRTSGLVACRGRMVLLPPIVHEHVQ